MVNKYWSFLFKITIRNKFNFFPFIILLAISIVLLIMNTNVHPTVGYIGTIQTQNQNLTELINVYNGYDANEISKADMEEINTEKEHLLKVVEDNKRSIEFANQNKWTNSVELTVKTIENTDMKMLENDEVNSPPEYKKMVLTNLAKFKYLAKNNLKPDAHEMEIQGFPFTFRMIDVLFPVIVIVCLITILTNIFTETFKQGVDIDNLFPIRKSKLITSKLLFGFIITLGVYISLLIISFIFASIANGTSSVNYPISINTPRFTDIRPIKYLMLEGLFLQALCIIFSVLFVYTIAFVTKNKIATLFTSILVLCGTSLSVTELQPLFSVLHFIPTTYFNTISVLTKDVAVNSNNSSVTFSYGIITLVSWILLEIFVIFLANKRYNLGTVS